MMTIIYQNTKHAIQRFIKVNKCVTAIEYGLIAAATAVVIIAVLPDIKTKLAAIFTSIGGAL